MRLVGYELKKLTQLPALWVFLLLCLILNLMLILTDNYELKFFNETSNVAVSLGQKVDDNFIKGLEELPQTENLRDLLDSTVNMIDVFADYDTASLSAHYERIVEDSPLTVQWMQKKYEKLALRVAGLAESGGGMDLYAGPITQIRHQFLFGKLLCTISAESCILAVLAVLYLIGYENQNKTELVICTSKKGRRLWRTKAFAGILAALFMYLILASLSLGVYFILWDYSGVWSANVSSGFNYIREFPIIKPFITWTDFTVAKYLVATLTLIGAMTVICGLSASIIGNLISNTYISALAVMILGAIEFAIITTLANMKLWVLYVFSCFMPVTLWTTQSIWFTELGMNSVLPWQETITAALGLIIFGFGAHLSLRYFYRKDIM